MARPRKEPQQRAKVELVWSVPPERDGSSMYDEVITEIKKSPGRWARVRVTATNGGAYTARKSFLSRAKDPRWEVWVRPIEGTTDYGVWVRYRTPEQMEGGNGA
jgi:hypothetical protein